MTMPPITLPELDPVTLPINRTQDLLLIRQGFADRKATVAQVTQTDLTSLPFLPDTPIASDVFLVGRNVAGNYVNYKALAPAITFGSGTRIWFYSATPPPGWNLVPDTGDRVLATVLPGGADYTYNTAGLLGDWLQSDHALTVEQMPSHSHYVGASHGSGDSELYFRTGQGRHTPYNPTATTGGLGSSTLASTPDNPGPTVKPTVGHNHGFQWRPAALVGCIGEKA
jgi:hypothetical protein